MTKTNVEIRIYFTAPVRLHRVLTDQLTQWLVSHNSEIKAPFNLSVKGMNVTIGGEGPDSILNDLVDFIYHTEEIIWGTVGKFVPIWVSLVTYKCLARRETCWLSTYNHYLEEYGQESADSYAWAYSEEYRECNCSESNASTYHDYRCDEGNTIIHAAGNGQEKWDFGLEWDGKQVTTPSAMDFYYERKW